MSKVCVPINISLDLVVSLILIPPSLGLAFISQTCTFFNFVQEFIGDEKGHVKGIRTVEIKWVQVRILFPWHNSVCV